MRSFGKPRVFGEVFGSPAGGAPTLAQLLSQLGDLAGHQPMTNTVRRVSTNTLGVVDGAQLLPNGDFSGGLTGWNTILTPTTLEVVEFEGFDQAHVITDQAGEGVRSNVFGDIGNTYELTAVVTVVSVTGGGNVRVLLTSSFNNQLFALTAPGNYSVTVTGVAAANVRTQFDVQAVAASEFYVRSVVLRQIGENDGQASAAGVTFGITDYRGAANEAFDLDGSAGVVTVVDTSYDGLTSLMQWGIFTPDSITANRRLFFKSGEWDVLMNADGTLTATVNYGTTNATRTTSTAIVVDTPVDIGFEIGADKVLHIYIAGVEAEYASSQAGEGTRASTTNDMQLGKDASTNGFDGDIAAWVYADTAPGPAWFASMSSAAGIT
jgi:hypothetical protein